MKYTKHTLKNGLRILLAPMHETETVTVFVMTGVGSRFESRKENGLAHFLEHMFFKGTTKRPTALDISKELDAVGAEYNAFTGKEMTGYYAKVEAHHADIALDVVSDIFMNAKLEEAEIDRERGAILQEINMYEDMPMRHIGDLFEGHLYGDHPLGWEIVGPKENIKTFKRKDFVKYLERGYVSGNVVVGIAGKLDPKTMLTEVKKRFAHIREGKRPEYKRAIEKQKTPALFVREKKTDQTHLLLGVRTYDAEHKDRYVLAVLATILGGGMSSRLFIEVRERRGLAYSVHTAADSFHDAGYLATQCGVEHENLEQTIAVILAEYRKIATEEVPQEELSKAKEYLKGKLALGLEGSDDVVEYLVTQEVLRGRITLPKDKVKAIDTVSVQDVLRVARDIFVDRKLNLGIIGPRADQAKLAGILKLDV